MEWMAECVGLVKSVGSSHIPGVEFTDNLDIVSLDSLQGIGAAARCDGGRARWAEVQPFAPGVRLRRRTERMKAP